MARKRKKQKTLKKPSRALALVSVFIATTTTALISFISLELAFITFGLFAFCALIYEEIRRRQFWELAASFKFKTLKDRQDALSKEVRSNSKDIDQLKDSPRGGREKTKPSTPPMEIEIPAPVKQPRATKPQLPEYEVVSADMPDDHYDSISDNVVRELVQNAMHHKRVDVFVQPIMRLPQRQVRFYEMFGRIRARPGQYLPASRYMEIAEQDNLDAEIDSLLLLHGLKTIQSSAHVRQAAPFFINIKNSTLKNTAFMKRLLGFVSKNRALAPRLIFEIKQKDFDQMPPALLEIVRGLGTLGCSFSLDHVHNLKMDIQDLQHFKIRFVKIDANTLLNSMGSERDFSDTHRNKRKLEANGIGVIIEKIETEEQIRELLDFDIHYGQGYLLGKPDLEGAYKKSARAKRAGQRESFV